MRPVPNSHSPITPSILCAHLREKEYTNTHTHKAMAEGRIWQPGKIIITVGTLVRHHMTPRTHGFGNVHRKSGGARTQVNSFHVQRPPRASRQEISCERAAWNPVRQMSLFGLASLLIRPQAFRDTPAVSRITRSFFGSAISTEASVSVQEMLHRMYSHQCNDTLGYPVCCTALNQPRPSGQ